MPGPAGSERDLKGFEAIDRVPGDVLAPGRASTRAMEGCAAIVHLVGIIREHRARGVTFDRLHRVATENMLRVAQEAGVPRYLHMSALGTRPDARSAYHRTKWPAEEAVRASGLDWTIFRPSIIFGPGDEFISVLAGMVRRLPARARARRRPVPPPAHPGGAGRGGLRARRSRASAAMGQTYEVAGPAPYRFVDILDQIGAALGRRDGAQGPCAAGPVRVATRCLQWLPCYPISSDQLTMLEEESVVRPAAVLRRLAHRSGAPDRRAPAHARPRRPGAR